MKYLAKVIAKTWEFSAGVIVAYEDQYLLLRLYSNWDFPKGHVEEGERPYTAAKRELQEETGLKSSNLSWPLAQKFTEVEWKKSGTNWKRVRLYYAESDTDQVKISKEHHAFRWVPYKDALGLLPERYKQALKWMKV